MGFINNQWLDGTPLRNRKHGPISAKIVAEPVTNDWDREHDVKASLCIRRSNGDYQYLLFTDDDLKSLVSIAASADEATKQKIALAALSKASEQTIVSFLQALFDKRSTKVA